MDMHTPHTNGNDRLREGTWHPFLCAQGEREILGVGYMGDDTNNRLSLSSFLSSFVPRLIKFLQPESLRLNSPFVMSLILLVVFSCGLDLFFGVLETFITVPRCSCKDFWGRQRAFFYP